MSPLWPRLPGRLVEAEYGVGYYEGVWAADTTESVIGSDSTPVTYLAGQRRFYLFMLGEVPASYVAPISVCS